MQLTQRNVNKRIHIIHYTILAIIFGLLTRLFYLQVIEHEELKKKAENQQRRPIALSKKRGLITDRNGDKNVLAIDTRSISLYAYPKEYNLEKVSMEKMAEKISPIIGKDLQKTKKTLSTRSFIWLKRQLPESYISQIKALKLPGINYVFESKRVYPKKELASSLLGFTGIDNQGLTGIEHSFESVLTGKTEQEKIFLDARGYEVLSQENKAQVTTSKAKTNKIRLTLDENIQHIAERELKKGLDEYKAKRGAAIIMDLDNGDLLALATYPNYDINQYSKFLENPKNWETIKNWAVTDVYEPGSTMKIFSFAAALEKKKTSLNEVIVCPGAIKVDHWTVHDHGTSPSQVRYLKPLDIIKTSSNVGTSIVTRRIPTAEHRDILLKFGFGKPTDSSLSGEVGGIVPKLPWVASRQSTISFGQGIAVTPLQIVTAMSAIVRKGIRIEPRIIKEIVDNDDKVIKQYKSNEIRTLSEDTAEKMRELLIAVVEDKEGTGRATKIPGYVIGGKTGTADKVENGRYSSNVISSFLGFYPAEKPRILEFVLYDSPQTAHFASMTAVPVFKNIASDIIKYLHIPPSQPEELLDKVKRKKLENQ
ncbi:MAG: penicillin-binding protein 2 [Candidatus Sericytochromatia bacterium]|nr:penicillin-binding protein 2 [Candidatus Sericytochromatia bacterium]